MHHLTLSFLDAFQASLGGKPLTHFRSAKVQGLLIYLALTAPQAHEREVLATFFWPNDPEEIAKRNLRQSLYRLRRVLGDMDSEQQPSLLITRASVQFNPTSHYSLDVIDFLAALADEALETAVSFYQGELLPGFTCDSLPFDEWLRQEREQYHRQALSTLTKLTAHSLARAAFPTAEHFARQQLRLEPWREEAHQQLIQALALQGERSAAIAHYETCRAILAEELGIEPTAETKNLLKHIQAQSVAPKPDAPQARRRLTIPFVGRQAEYETLVNAYRQIKDGLQVVTLLGKAGIGKTRLTQYFLAWAATQGADVLVGRSFENSTGLSYQPLIQLLRQRIERENAPEDLLSDLWLSQLTRLLPELRERYPDLPEPTLEENTARQHLFEATARLGQALATRQPLVLFIDDWHWADTASLDVLQYATQRWAEEKTPIFVLLTLRQEVLTESPDLQSWLNQLKHTVSVGQLDLGPLSQAETNQLVQALLTPKEENGDGALADVATAAVAVQSSLSQFSDWLFKETDGQPLFLTEALKVLVEDGVICPEPNTAPLAGSTSLSSSRQAVWHLDWARFDAQRAESHILAGVREIIQGWLTRIPAPANELLTAAAVLAQEASFDQLC